MEWDRSLYVELAIFENQFHDSETSLGQTEAM